MYHTTAQERISYRGDGNARTINHIRLVGLVSVSHHSYQSNYYEKFDTLAGISTMTEQIMKKWRDNSRLDNGTQYEVIQMNLWRYGRARCL